MTEEGAEENQTFLTNLPSIFLNILGLFNLISVYLKNNFKKLN
jgi:hypothetical protein